jgi:putative endonuclease
MQIIETGRRAEPRRPIRERKNTMKGWMYILECADGTYYTGSTNDLSKRLWEHDNLLGANYTRKRHPVKLVYYEEFNRIDDAFYREKQVQRWSHAKKKALIEQQIDLLHEFAECRNESHCRNNPSVSTSLDDGVVTDCLFNAPLSDQVVTECNANIETDAKEKFIMKENNQTPFWFTVAQLIEVLKTFPPDLPVLTSGIESGYENFYHPQVVRMKHEPETYYKTGEFQVVKNDSDGTFDAVVIKRVTRYD